jgi:hypothetical protein
LPLNWIGTRRRRPKPSPIHCLNTLRPRYDRRGTIDHRRLDDAGGRIERFRHPQSRLRVVDPVFSLLKGPSMHPDWIEYKRRRRTFWLAFLLFPLWIFPGATLQDYLAGRGYDGRSLVTFLVVLVPPMACLMVVSLRLIFWPCPRCGRPLHCTWWYGNPWFARQCLHCGLPKWTPKQKPDETDFA